MTTTKYKRRTFKDVAAEAYAKGWSDGREQGRKDVEKDYDTLLDTNMQLNRSIMALESRLDKINGSLITALRYWAKGHV